MPFEYFIFNLIIITSALIGSRFVKQLTIPLKPIFITTIIIAIPYLIWDALVAGHWWSFNPDHILGLTVSNLPLEEILFFITVPAACLILWHGIKDNCTTQSNQSRPHFIIFAAFLILITVGPALTYWRLVSALSLVILIIDYSTAKLITSPAGFTMSFAILTLTLVFNGYLTARPVVTYAPAAISGVRLFTIPIEDFLYGLTLIWSNIILYQALQRRQA